MVPLHSPHDYLFNLYTTSSSEAKRLWRKHIKEQWNYQCAYCGSEDNITLDHIIPQCKGGTDRTTNLVCACKECNHSKGHEMWYDWYMKQDFFTVDRLSVILEWQKQILPNQNLIYCPTKL
tara:strand:- start:1539 stop:1901 length:363 start_codon:yes stop_codon:yes gene_type:complete